MYVTRVHLRTELQSSSGAAAAATSRQLDEDRKQLSKDAASGNMTAEIIDFVDISVVAVAAAAAQTTTSSSTTSVALPAPDELGTSQQDLASAQTPVAQVPPSTVVNEPDPLATTAPANGVSAAATTPSTVHPGR